ncbi:hypothetical protein LSCM1_08124 [Leishmania martiniquensis]|uniref:Uncharacterized protein n=1 Tax=Leishmania martiniquensis TaxID=1580590 RepID=A0A836HUA7_9TRYP|nr:hypothetical protein LSCM1_08124 [Leishmania martiniquensis]
MKSSNPLAPHPPLSEHPSPSSNVVRGPSPTHTATATTATATSLLSRLEHVVAAGSRAVMRDTELSELPLLWAAMESSASMAAGAASSSSASMTSAEAAGTLHDGLHARFIAETTGLLWGGDYPSWMVQQWERLDDADDDEEDSAHDDADVESDGSCLTGVSSGETADRSVVGRERERRDSEKPVKPHLSSHGASPPTLLTSPQSKAERAEEAVRAAASDSEPPVQVPSPSWTLLMRQALEALQLHLPLHHGSTPPQLPQASTGEAPTATLAKHLVQDAPLLWLQYLLVPMYTQWTQQRAVAPPAAATAPTATTTSTLSSSSSLPVTTALELDGAVTMHELLAALATASTIEALRREQSWSDDLVELVGAAVTAHRSAAEATLKALHERQAAMQDQQRQHLGQMLYFSGTLAKAAQSFMVLGEGGFAILAALIVRLLGRARAAWVEWVSQWTEADVQSAAQVMCRSGLDEASADCVSSHDANAGGKGDERDTPAGKRVRVEPSLRASASLSGAPRVAAAESFAALRTAVSTVARRQAHLVWRCWYILYGYYGADLYTNEALSRALEEEELEKGGVRRMAAAQQAHWRQLRLAADVKQHTLSETHWLWCSTLLAAVEATLMAAPGQDRAEGRAPLGTCATASATAATDVSPVCATELLYRRLMGSAVRDFTAELRNTLRVYGEAALAHRSGGLHSFVSTAPSALQRAAHNTVALQAAFAQCLVASLAQSPASAMSPRQAAWSATRARTGVYLWQLYPTLLRVQVPEESSWMSTAGTEKAGDAVGAGDAAEVAAGQFAEQFQRHWRRRGRQLSAVLSDASHRMEQTLTHGRHHTASPSTLPSACRKVATLAAVAPVSQPGGRSGAGDGAAVASLLAAIVYSPAKEAAASSSSSASNDAWSMALSDVAADFYAVYDQSCFFVLRPERQRLFTRSVQRLHRLLVSSPVGGAGGSTPSRPAASGSVTKTAPPLYQQPLVCLLRRDTRLWMLLTHGVLLQLERRGRMAREDEALLTSHLLPLMALLASRQHSGEATQSSTDSSSPFTETEATPVWADTDVAKDVLLLLASGLASLPWDLEGLYLTVQRHTALCLHHRKRHQGRPSPDGASAATVAEMAAWLGATGPASPSAVPASPTVSVTSPRGFPDVEEGRAPTPRSGRGAAALSWGTAQRDAEWWRDDPLLLRRREEEGPAYVAADAHSPVLAAPPRLSEDAVEARLAAALARHGRLAAVFLASAPCGLLMVVGAYRSCGRALHSLRAALEEQHRMAREDEAGEFVGRSVAYCTSEDITAFRGLVTIVHNCVFSYACQPRGLLRLWLGYLQHLFDCVVPRSVSPSPGDPTGSEGERTLVLMPSSWQRQHRVTTLFGAQVHRTGWRALQHDGEPASQTRLREVLGECLANLTLLPYTHSGDDSHFGGDESAPPQGELEHKGAATATQEILQRTLPHAVLETLCELLCIPVEADQGSASDGKSSAAMEAAGKAVGESFLGLAGLLAFLRQLELLVIPGSLQDCRLTHLLRCVYAAADAAALGI